MDDTKISARLLDQSSHVGEETSTACTTRGLPPQAAGHSSICEKRNLHDSICNTREWSSQTGREKEVHKEFDTSLFWYKVNGKGCLINNGSDCNALCVCLM